MSRKKVFMLFLTCVFLVTGLGIGQASAKTLQFGMITKNLVNPGFVMMYEAGKLAAEDLGIELSYAAPMKPDNVLEQISIMENLIQRKVDCILVCVADSEGIIPGILKANRAGIPVVTLNSAAAGGDIVAHVGATNYEGAYSSGKYLADYLGGKGKIIILEGTPGSETAAERKRGFEDVLKENPGITVIASQTALFQRKEGMRVMENLLSRFPEIDGIMSCNDEMAIGAVQAIKAAGRMDEIKIAGFDGVFEDVIEAICRDEILVTVDQDLHAQGYWPVVAGWVHVTGDCLVPKLIPISTVQLTNDKEVIEAWLKRRKIDPDKWLKERGLELK